MKGKTLLAAQREQVVPSLPVLGRRLFRRRTSFSSRDGGKNGASRPKPDEKRIKASSRPETSFLIGTRSENRFPTKRSHPNAIRFEIGTATSVHWTVCLIS
jgi:hypothetical protein